MEVPPSSGGTTPTRLEIQHLKGCTSANFPAIIGLDPYRRRNVIERMFGKLKNWRRIATRYDRLARNYLAAKGLLSKLD
jgi:transposase